MFEVNIEGKKVIFSDHTVNGRLLKKIRYDYANKVLVVTFWNNTILDFTPTGHLIGASVDTNDLVKLDA